MKNLILSALILTALLFNACRKSEEKLSTYPLDADVKAAFTFPLGTYWIYKDSISGETDSLYVTNTVEGVFLLSSPIAYAYQIWTNIIGRNYSSMADSSEWSFTLARSGIQIQYNDYLLISDTETYNDYAAYGAFVYPFFIYSYHGDTLTNVINSFAVNGNTFNNVGEIHFADAGNGQDDYIYLAANTGMVKMVQNHPYDTVHRVWELQRWKIAQ